MFIRIICKDNRIHIMLYKIFKIIIICNIVIL